MRKLILTAFLLVPAMALATNYTVNSAKTATSTALTVDKITFAAGCGSNGIIVFNHGTSDLWVRSDGTDPTVQGDNTFYVPANNSSIYLTVATNPPSVRLISSLATEYTVECP